MIKSSWKPTLKTLRYDHVITGNSLKEKTEWMPYAIEILRCYEDGRSLEDTTSFSS